MNITLEELKTKARELGRGITNSIYLHWTGGYYDTHFWDYHINIGPGGEIFLTCDSLDELKSHTWRRNTGAIGIALCCCVEAKANDGFNSDLGSNPPTNSQIESLSQIVAILTEELGVSMDRVLTHQEAATEDGYGPYSGDPETRWDLWFLPDYCNNNNMVTGGDLIRGKARFYLTHKTT